MRRAPLALAALLAAGCPAPPAPSDHGGPPPVVAPPAPGPSAATAPRPRPSPAVELRPAARFPGAPLIADSEPNDVVFSPDGKLLASGGGADSGATILLWDPGTGQRVGTLHGDRGDVVHLAFSPDGKLLVATDLTLTVTVWDVAARRPAHHFQEHRASVGAAAFSPDGRSLASLDSDGVVVIRELDGGKPPRRHELGEGTTHTLAFSPDGRTVAVSTRDGIALVDAAGKRAPRRIARRADISAVAYTPDGAALITVEVQSDHSTILGVRDPSSGRRARTLGGAREGIDEVVVSRDGKVVAAPSKDGIARAWDLASGQPLAAARAAVEGPLWSAALSPDGGTLAAAGRARAILLADARTGAPRFAQDGHTEHVNLVAYAPGGARIASSDHAGRVIVRDAGSGAVVLRLPDQKWSLSTLAFSPDGGTLLTVAHGEARRWDAATGAERSRWSMGRITALTYSPDGRLLVGADETRVVTLLDATTGAAIRTLGAAQPGDGARQNLMEPSSVAFSPDGRRLAVARWDQDVHVWDVASGDLIRTLPGLLWVGWSPDGRVIAAGSGTIHKRSRPEDLEIRLWDAETGAERGRLEGYPMARFSPDGALLATLSAGELELWDVGRVQRVGCGMAPGHGALSLAFAPDGRAVVTGGGDGSVAVWRLEGVPGCPANAEAAPAR